MCNVIHINKKMIPTNVYNIMDTLEKGGHDAYIIGGASRDILLGETPDDYDVFTDATGDKILKLFPKGKVMGGEERQEKILTVVVDGIEVSQYRKNGERTETTVDLDYHLKTCDFTFNAIVMDKTGKIVLDTFDGERDLLFNEIKFIGYSNDRIKEDPLRILRAVRFKSKYKDIHYGYGVCEALYENKEKLLDIPIERIRDEFLKLLNYSEGISELNSLRMLPLILPEISDVEHLEGGKHHDESVYRHMMYAYEYACKYTDNKLLRLACFLHDIGKGSTAEEIDGDMKFYTHEKESARITNEFMNRLKFANEKIRYVETLVKNHMVTLINEQITKKGYLKLFNKLDEGNVPIEDYVMMLYCDNQANLANEKKPYNDFIKELGLTQKYYEFKYTKEPFNIKDLEIGGKDLIKLGLKQGPLFGKILNLILEQVMDGKLKNNRADLMHDLKKRIENIKNGI